MADFSALHSDLAALRATIETETAQVVAKLDELAGMLSADALDDQEIATARATVAELSAMVSRMVPDL